MTNKEYDPAEPFDLVAEARKIIDFENIFTIKLFPENVTDDFDQLAVKKNSKQSGATVWNWDPVEIDPKNNPDSLTRLWIFFPIQLPHTNQVAFYIANYASGLLLGVDHKQFADNSTECQVKLYDWSDDPNTNERPIYFFVKPLDSSGKIQITAAGGYRLALDRKDIKNGHWLRLFPPDKDQDLGIKSFVLESALNKIGPLPTLSDSQKTNSQLNKNFSGVTELNNQDDSYPFAKQAEEIRRELTQATNSATDSYSSTSLDLGKTILPYFMIDDPNRSVAQQIQQSPYYYVEKSMSFEMVPGSLKLPFGADREIELSESTEDRITDEFSFESKTSIGLSTTEEANQGVAKESFTLSLTQEFDMGTRTAKEQGHTIGVKETFTIPANNAFAEFYKVYTLKVTPMYDPDKTIASTIVSKDSAAFPVTGPLNN